MWKSDLTARSRRIAASTSTPHWLISTQVKNIADTLEKKLQHGAARRDKRKNLKDFEIKPDYVDEPFARGGQAVVRLAEYAAETVCIKCINMVGVPAAERMKMYSSFATELSIMVRLRHPRIVQVLGIITTDATYLGLVMEYMPGGSLRQALVKEDAAITPEFQPVWNSTGASGAPDNYSLSHLSAMTRPCWVR